MHLKVMLVDTCTKGTKHKLLLGVSKYNPWNIKNGK